MGRYKFNAFLSHASEDKASFVEPLAHALVAHGLKVWFDRFSLQLGDSLRESIELGLSKSRWGVVILSEHFLSKRWPTKELNGLFTREMLGQKVILPIRLGLTHEALAKRLLMQADMFTIDAADGVEEVARALVARIKPKLLEVDVKKNLLSGSSHEFLRSARSKYPGYDFSVTFGEPVSAMPASNLGRVSDGQFHVDVRHSSGDKPVEPPKIHLTFVGEGVRKFKDFVETGKPQTWVPGEHTNLTTTFPLAENAIGNAAMISVEQQLKQWREVTIALTLGEQTERIALSVSSSRAGAKEAEAVFSSSTSPISLTLVLCKVTGEMELNSTIDLYGKSFVKCAEALRAWDLLMTGANLVVIDNTTGSPIFSGGQVSIDRTGSLEYPLLGEVRQVIALIALIESKFHVAYSFGEDSVSPDDEEALKTLDCLLNGKEFDGDFSGLASLKKENGVDLDKLIAETSEDVQVFLPVDPYTGNIRLMGKDLPIEKWGLYGAGGLVNIAEFRRSYEKAAWGDIVEFQFVANDGSYLKFEAQAQALMKNAG